MRVIGTYWIGNIDIECDCGHEEHYILDEDDFPFEDEGNYNNVWVCPSCGKTIDVNYFVDDNRTDDLYFDELEELGL